MDKDILKRRILDQSGEALRAFLAKSTVAITEYSATGINSFGSGTCVHHQGHYLIMTAAHVIEGISRERLSLAYEQGRGNKKVKIDAVYHRKDRLTGLDVGFLVLSPEVAQSLNKEFLSEKNFDLAPTNLATDLVALNGFPNGLFHFDGKKHYKFASFTFVTLCESEAKWYQPINFDMQIEFGYPDVIKDAKTDQPFIMPNVEGMSGGGMWLLNINPKRFWSPESCKLVGIIARWNESKQYVRGNRVVHWLQFADEILHHN